ncbi:MAG TPA: lipid-A-disaccharide synthase [Gammaproteobacteria bacterium]|nr:lipid-A-disaccharide synthase [Gammaproteobacteria bacterium]
MELSDLVKLNVQRVGIVAGEMSGDILGAGLIYALQALCPSIHFEGIGGKRMIEAGFQSLFPMDELAVMGLIEPLKRLPRILSIRRSLFKHFTKHPPDVFIGIDSPDFNLTLEEKLKQNKIPTIQYVGPTIWAWRAGRVHKIKRAADKVLVLFPFEKAHYDKMNIPATVVGHTLADEIPLESSKESARVELGLPLMAPLVTLMPGSRKGVMAYLSGPFIQTGVWLQKKIPSVQFLVALANEKRRNEFQSFLKGCPENLPITAVVNNTRQAICAADAVLLSSGTGTLETMLMKRPMVVAYKMSALTFQLAKRIVKVDHIALPNLLAGERLVPEFIQGDVTPEKMGQALFELLNKDTTPLIRQFHKIHLALRQDASQKAAIEVLKTIKECKK